MGSYINEINGLHLGASAMHKILVLIGAGAEAILDRKEEPVQSPEKFQENMICVVDNGHFAAAAYAYNEAEYKAFLPTTLDIRPRYWFIFKKAKDCAEPKYWE